MGTIKHLSMKSVFSSLCIFLALLATAAEAATRTPVTLNQVVTFKDVTKAKWTANLKKTFELGYLKANGYSTDTALITGITYTSTAVAAADAANVKVTFVVTQGATFEGTAVTVTSTATASQIRTAIGQVKAATAEYNTDPTVIEPVADTDVVPLTATVAVPTAAPTSSASGVVQFSQIALSIPVVAMVISKICYPLVIRDTNCVLSKNHT